VVLVPCAIGAWLARLLAFSMARGPGGKDWFDGICRRCHRDAEGRTCVAGLTKTEAEHLLDYLEILGTAAPELTLDGEKGFLVRWRQLASEGYAT
jgi:hypothetical protein